MKDKDVIATAHRGFGDAAGEESVREEHHVSTASGAQRGRDNRGHRAAVTRNGEVVGSGAASGGGGAPEDFDSDPQAGGGRIAMRHGRAKPDVGADASQHGSS